jgi:hypothetical protein
MTVHQAEPFGDCDDCNVFDRYLGLGFGADVATTEAYTETSRGYNQSYTRVATFTTDLSLGDIVRKLETYAEAFNRQQLHYGLNGPNCNTYAAGAWEALTGSVPALPKGLVAPGWPGSPGVVGPFIP